MPFNTHDRVQELQQEIDKATEAAGVQETAVLTSRQQEVLQLLAQGLTMKETNFGLENNSDLVRFAIRRQLISFPLPQSVFRRRT